jgi:methylated-DNA-protein-cysteine methyltransferase related protein
LKTTEPEELRHVSKRKELFEEVYRLTRLIPRGKVSTYGALGLAVEPEVSPRVIGYVMSICPYPNDQVPCHRVIKSDGAIGGYGEEGVRKKIELLEKEGITVKDGRIELSKYLFDFGKPNSGDDLDLLNFVQK